MKTLIFGGQSSSNREWVNALVKQLSAQGGDYVSLCHEYLAWSSKTNSDDVSQIELEIENAQAKYRDCNFDMIIGKSFGCLMAVESKINSEYIVLIGPPVLALKELHFDLMKAIKLSSSKILIMMNADDPLVERADLEAYVRENPSKVILHILSGNHHKYEDINTYASIIDCFLNQKQVRLTIGR
ncbi:MAG: hypothetical protein AB1598_15045 [Thermodesulfobacteriota bacterium]